MQKRMSRKIIFPAQHETTVKGCSFTVFQISNFYFLFIFVSPQRTQRKNVSRFGKTRKAVSCPLFQSLVFLISNFYLSHHEDHEEKKKKKCLTQRRKGAKWEKPVRCKLSAVSCPVFGFSNF